MKHKAYIIAGPTASGKSEFAHRLACRVNGTIINCDSVQIYRDIEIISASPFANRSITDSIDGIPYKLFSILPLSEQISVGQYITMARREYDVAIANGRVPIFVGGTGYYINAIINGISPMPDVSDENRMRARKMVADDIVAARRMLPTGFVATDPQRVARAIEVFLQTGNHIDTYQSAPRVGAIIPTPYRILINPSTDVLRNRIAARIPQMLASGAQAEAQRIVDLNLDDNRAIGATQLCNWIRGNIEYDECITQWITKTNQYAKRQRTWFRTQYVADKIINRIASDADIDDIISDK